MRASLPSLRKNASLNSFILLINCLNMRPESTRRASTEQRDQQPASASDILSVPMHREEHYERRQHDDFFELGATNPPFGCAGRHGISRAVLPICTAWVRRFAPSLSNSRLEWVFTVFSLTKS